MAVGDCVQVIDTELGTLFGHRGHVVTLTPSGESPLVAEARVGTVIGVDGANRRAILGCQLRRARQAGAIARQSGGQCARAGGCGATLVTTSKSP
jgi:hypothetical protein